MVANTSAGESYSPPIAYIYIFNLIVGVGALALPLGFQLAGLILGLIFLAVAGFLAFVTLTWINEVQASANAIIAIKERDLPEENEKERTPLITPNGSIQNITVPQTVDFGENVPLVSKLNSSVFEIKRRIELGLLSEMFLGSIGHKLFYVVLVTYLYGDLAIYAVAIPKSLTAVVGGWCIGSFCVSDYDAYYLYLSCFVILIVPWSFFNFQKTKPLQLMTLCTRNVALFTMIILGLIYIAKGEGAQAKDLTWFNFEGLPSLFGVSIYAFMCHHSLPSLVTPISNKNYLNRLLGADFILIFLVYALLCASALFAFGANPNPTCPSSPGDSCQIQSLYTLNFTSYSKKLWNYLTIEDVRFIAVFLSLFPVFTLSTNFPLIAITLRNNLMILVPWGEKHRIWGNATIRQIVFALIATVPPILLAFATRDVQILVNITGSYAGLGIMFVIPGFLLVWSRKEIRKLEQRIDHELINPHQSPFGHVAFLALVALASLISLGLVTFKLIYDAVK